jgi:hypothetical protein
MPLKEGTSPKTVSENIREIHSGKTYEATKAQSGKAAADKQAIAIAMDKKRESMSQRTVDPGVIGQSVNQPAAQYRKVTIRRLKK